MDEEIRDDYSYESWLNEQEYREQLECDSHYDEDYCDYYQQSFDDEF